MARLASRASNWLQLCTRPGGYYAGRPECIASPYHPDSNPEGFINMCLAESRLIEPHVHRRLAAGHAELAKQPGCPDYGYASSRVVADFEAALAGYLSSTLRCEIPRESLVLGAK